MELFVQQKIMEHLLFSVHCCGQRSKRHGFWFQGASSLVEETEFQKCPVSCLKLHHLGFLTQILSAHLKLSIIEPWDYRVIPLIWDSNSSTIDVILICQTEYSWCIGQGLEWFSLCL